MEEKRPPLLLEPDAAKTDGRRSEARAGRVTFLNQELWRRLSEAESPQTYASAWLALQCRIIPDAIGGAVVMGPADQGPFRSVASIPEGKPVTRHLLAAGERAMAERRGVAQASKNNSTALAFPILIDGKLHGVACLEIEGADSQHVRQRMRELQWGAQALEYALFRNDVAPQIETKNGLLFVHELQADVIEEPSFEAAAMALVTELSQALKCDRVALGFRSRGRVTVRALSHSAQFSRRMNVVRQISNAMDEAIDQVAIVVHPAPEDGEVQLDSAHRDLARGAAAKHLLTVPFATSERIIGALLLERTDDRAFTPHEIETVEYLGAAVGAVLDEKRRNDRLLIFKIGESVAVQLQRLFGPSYYGRKCAVLAVAAVATFFSIYTTTYRVASDAVLEGTVQRSMIAAYEGYVRDEYARAGDVVQQGDVLAELDTRDLMLERSRRIAEHQELNVDYLRALAEGERAFVNILNHQMAQSTAQINLLDGQIARAAIRAPFDGIVVSGDLSQLVGAAVQRGDELFTLAPLDSYRVILRVDEAQTADVDAGQGGTLLLSSLPETPLPIVIERITPVAEAHDGRTQFRVEATITEDFERLRPGMEGIAKIEVGERHLIWIWTRGLVDWARLKIWRYWP